MLTTLFVLLLGVLSALLAVGAALTLVLAKLTQKNLQRLQEWENMPDPWAAAKTEQRSQQQQHSGSGASKETARSRHRRNVTGLELLPHYILREGHLVVTDAKGGSQQACWAELRFLTFALYHANEAGGDSDSSSSAPLLLRPLQTLSLAAQCRVAVHSAEELRLVVERGGAVLLYLSFDSRKQFSEWCAAFRKSACRWETESAADDDVASAMAAAKRQARGHRRTPAVLQTQQQQPADAKLTEDTDGAPPQAPQLQRGGGAQASNGADMGPIPFAAIDNSTHPVASADWLNLMMWRHFLEMATYHVFMDKVEEKVQKQLAKMLRKRKEAGKWPSFLQPLRFRRVITGNGFIRIHGVRMDRTSQENELMGEIDAEYCGGAGVVLATSVLLAPFGSLIARLPVEIEVKMHHIRGVLYLHVPSDADEKYSLCFKHFPHGNVRFDIAVRLGTMRWDIAGAMDIVKRFVRSLLHVQLAKRLVYPSRLRFFLPFPGRKMRPKLQRWRSAEELKKRGATDPLTYEASHARTPSLEEIEGREKSERRALFAKHFFERVLGTIEPSSLAEFCDPHLIVTGFSDIDNEIKGIANFKVALTDLKRRFAEVRMTPTKLHMTGEGALFHWELRGQQVAKLWDRYPPLDPQQEVTYSGMLYVFFNASDSIVGMEYYWMLRKKESVQFL